MSILAIDYGKKRIGLAVSSTVIPTPLPPITVDNFKNVFLKISEIINEYSVSVLVLGLPLNMDESFSEMANDVQKFGDELKKRVGLEVVFVDERLTSKEAEQKLAATEKNWRKRKNKIDSASACLILQNYLDRKNENKK